MKFSIGHVSDVFLGKAGLFLPRSSEWRHTEQAHLKLFPTCAACGGKEKLNVHHVEPFHLFPAKENLMSNLITLCESGRWGVTCHQHFGHSGNFKSYNPHVREDVAVYQTRIKERETILAKGKKNV